VGSAEALKIAVLGGVPALLGGGGLELQAQRTVVALRGRGHDARHVAHVREDWPFDILHVIGHNADVGHVLHHWRRHPARLVVSPVLVVPQHREWRLSLATRLPIPAFEPRILRALVERADHLIALTAWEASFLRQRVAASRRAPIAVIGNGVDLPSSVPDPALELPDAYVVTVGAVSRRKRQLAIARELAGEVPYVVVGGWDGPPNDRPEFEAAVDATGGRWLGEVHDTRRLLSIVRGARALVHLSDAEGQSLAVLEALALGTPCVLSDLPQQRELAARWSAYIRIIPDGGSVSSALAGFDEPGGPQPQIPTWDDVAAALEPVYQRAMAAGPARVWSARG
jgi:glycosyltransferase involved in cell wall biosynthesis